MNTLSNSMDMAHYAFDHGICHFDLKTSPLEYRNKIILQNAKAMLLGGDMSIKEISSILGFNDIAYFSRFFKKHTKLSPSNSINAKRQKTN